MALNTSSGNLAFLASEVGQLLVRPAIAASVAATVSTVISTGSNTFRIPILAADGVNAAAWTPEGSEIAVSDPTLTELVITPTKVAGLTIISREMAEDSSPECATLVGDSLARQLARAVDAAFFANTTVNGPSGLLSLVTATSVEAATSFSTLDSFAAAVFTAEAAGANITSFITSPAEALALSTLKETTGSTRPLLTADVTTPTSRTIYGRPLLTAPTIGPKIGWAIDQSRTFCIIRSDATVEVDRSVFFTSDRVAVKATMRVGFGFAHPAALVKISHA